MDYIGFKRAQWEAIYKQSADVNNTVWRPFPAWIPEQRKEWHAINEQVEETWPGSLEGDPSKPTIGETDLVAARAQALGLNGHSYGDVNTALQQAMSKAGKQDLIVVCGSVFVVGEVSL